MMTEDDTGTETPGMNMTGTHVDERNEKTTMDVPSGGSDQSERPTSNLNDKTIVIPPVNPEMINKKYLHEFIVWVENERLKHTLAFDHFEKRSFLYMFIPITILTLASGILSALGIRQFDEEDDTNQYTEDSNQDKEDSIQDTDNTRWLRLLQKEDDEGKETGTLDIDLVFWSAIISFVTTFFNALQAKLNYRGRADMHQAASSQLKKLSFSLSSLDTVEIDSPTARKELQIKVDALVQTYVDLQNSCLSIIPYEINEPFNILENRIKTKFHSGDTIRSIYVEERKFYLLASNELSGAISSYKYLGFCPWWLFGFPLSLPSPNVSVNKALKNIEKALESEKNRKKF